MGVINDSSAQQARQASAGSGLPDPASRKSSNIPRAAIKTGLIGCGNVGHFHAQALSELAESEFVGVCGRDYEKTKTFGRQYNVPVFPSVEAMKTGAGVEAVCICSPHPAHRENGVDAAMLGIHLLIEKPLAESVESCDAILQAARESGAKVGVVSQRRFYNPCLRVKQAIDDGKLGKPVLGVVTMLGWRSKEYYDSAAWRGTLDGEGGGVLINQAPHQLDLLLWYMGEPAEIYGVCSNFNHPYIQVEDTAAAVIRFKNGGVGNILVSNSVNPALYGKVHIFGDNGAAVGVQTDGGAMFIAGMSQVTEPPVTDLWTIPGEDHMPEQWNRQEHEFYKTIDPTRHFHTVQIKDFLDSLLEGREPLVDGYAGRRTVELFEAIYRSQREGASVKMP